MCKNITLFIFSSLFVFTVVGLLMVGAHACVKSVASGSLIFTEYAEPMLDMQVTNGGHSIQTSDKRWRRVIFLDTNDAVIGDFIRP